MNYNTEKTFVNRFFTINIKYLTIDVSIRFARGAISPRCVCIGGDFLLIREQQGIRQVIGIVPIPDIFYGAVIISFVDLPFCCTGYFTFFHGDILAGLFAKDAPVIAAAAEYLKAYAIDTLLTAFLFCFIGYFNGTGATIFVMLQGIIGAFGVRVPVSWFISRQATATLFHIGLATPSATLVQIALCGFYFVYALRKQQQVRS